MLVQGIRFHISIVHDMASVGFPYKKKRFTARRTAEPYGNIRIPLFLIFVVLRSVRKWQEAGMWPVRILRRMSQIQICGLRDVSQTADNTACRQLTTRRLCTRQKVGVSLELPLTVGKFSFFILRPALKFHDTDSCTRESGLKSRRI